MRIIVWATPMLGFLGTVVGITDALGDLGPSWRLDAASRQLLNTAMQGLLGGLYVTFDTTAIALCFTMVLMFIQFMLDRSETQVLSAVDDRVASDELAGRFETDRARQPIRNVQAIQRMSQAVIKSTEQLVQRQAELWQQTIAAAHDQWQRVSRQSTEQMQARPGRRPSASRWPSTPRTWPNPSRPRPSSCSSRWEQWQTALSHNARLLHAQQQEMVKQGELMTQAIRVAGDVVQLERALNDNLSALAGSKNFEDTVMSLAAAIHLLNTRLGKHADTPHVELKAPQVKGRAA